MHICSSCGECERDKFYASQPYVCKTCVKARAKNWYLKNRDRALKNVSVYRAENRDRAYALVKDWARKNKAAVAVIKKRYKEKHPERRAATKNAWYISNKDRHASYMADRKSAKLCSIPFWADEFLIKEAYHLARLRTKMLGFKWHVDHIVPLKSELVCGLHCEQNLRVIPAVLNLSKHNKTWPDMP